MQSLRLCVAAATSAVLLGTLSGQAPTQKRVPPPGIEVPEAERRMLTAGAAALAKELDGLRAHPKAAELLPDVEIFHKAVDWALRYDEFFKKDQFAQAKALLEEGTARAKAMKAGQAPWTTATGLVVRGYRSKIDGSVQPYGLVVPDAWKAGDKRARRLDIFNHGRGENLTELSFINERMKKPGEFTPADTFVLHPYGRFCNATKFAGETDVFEALAHVRANYPIDPNRLIMTGFSMGGASVWHLTAHHSGLWAAASPGAGFAETPTYLKIFGPGKEPPPWWEQVLWRMYNANEYAANFANCPTIAYSGEEDAQKASADIMEQALANAGVKLERVIGLKVGHKYSADAKKELLQRWEEIAAKGREEVPSKVRLVTYTLQYPKQEWVEVTEMEKHWERAEVNAEIVDEGTIKIDTKNVTALTLEMEGKAIPLDKTHPPRVIVDGVELVGGPVTNPWRAFFRKVDGAWKRTRSAVDGIPLQTNGSPELRKKPGLQGPIDHAFMKPFIFVRPTGKPMHEATAAWVKAEIDRAVSQWRQVFRGDARLVDDTAVTPEMIEASNLVLWGDPSSNEVLKKIALLLPLKWTASEVQIGSAHSEGAHSVPVLIYPNPLNPNRYVVINSSFSFRQGSNASNATQTPKLPDWALVDIRTPATDTAPGRVIDAGFFDEHWRISGSPANPQ